MNTRSLQPATNSGRVVLRNYKLVQDMILLYLIQYIFVVFSVYKSDVLFQRLQLYPCLCIEYMWFRYGGG